MVINDLNERFQSDSSIGVAFICSDFSHKIEQNIEDLLASLLKQLTKSESALNIVKLLYDRHKGMGTRPLYTEILGSLQSVAGEYSRILVVIDALDELQASNGCRAKFLEALSSIQGASNESVFATSRKLPDITKRFETSMSLQIMARDEDVENYIDGQMYRLPDFVQKSEELKGLVKTKIIGSIRGMYESCT